MVFMRRSDTHPDRPEEPEPQKDGSFSSYERRPQYDHDSPLSIIGFRPNSKRG